MKTFIAAIVLAMLAGRVTAEIKIEAVDYKQGETVCEGQQIEGKVLALHGADDPCVPPAEGGRL